MKINKKAEIIVLIEKLRLIESEIFRITNKYGIKNVEELDKFIEKGKLSEEELGEDLFLLDYLISEKRKAEQRLKKLSVKKSLIWENLESLLELPKLSFRI